MPGLTYSIADQNFEKTKSLGILNLSMRLLESMIASHAFDRLTVLSNSSIQLPSPGAHVQICTQDVALKGRLQRVWWDQCGVYQAAKALGNEWLFLPKGFASFVRRPPCRLAAYVHDTMFDYYAANFPGSAPAFENTYFDRSLRATLKYAEVIFTNSDFTRAELQRYGDARGITPPTMVTAGIGFVADALPVAVKKNQIIVLTSKWPHKRTRLAMDYISRWQSMIHYVGTVHWVGSIPDGSGLGGQANWIHHPRLPENEFRKLLGESRALLFFTNYEGFGMPPVEAMLGHTCPVYSDIPVTREVMQGMGQAFNNDDFESFSAAMNKALTCEAAQIHAWRNKLLETHDWNQVVSRIVNALNS